MHEEMKEKYNGIFVIVEKWANWILAIDEGTMGDDEKKEMKKSCVGHCIKECLEMYPDLSMDQITNIESNILPEKIEDVKEARKRIWDDGR